jgi:adenylyl- and sulfurtransferase ThiI
MAVLVQNIRSALSANGFKDFSFSMRKGWIDVRGKKLEKMVPVLKTVFGLHEIALAEFVSSGDLETIVEKTVACALQFVRKGESFAVDCSRSGHQSFSSHDVEVKAGAAIQKVIPSATVDLTEPKRTVFVNIQSHGFFVYSETEKGCDGLPVGCQGRIGFFVGKKADGRAVWLLLRRGCEVIPIVFKKDYPVVLKKLEKWNSFRRFFVLEKKNLKEDWKKQGLLALATGDHKLSETALKKNHEFDSRFEIPVIRPLQAFDYGLLGVRI